MRLGVCILVFVWVAGCATRTPETEVDSPPRQGRSQAAVGRDSPRKDDSQSVAERTNPRNRRGLSPENPRERGQSLPPRTGDDVPVKYDGFREHDGGDPLSYDDLAALARARNPVLAAAENDVRAADGRATQAGLYPNPTAEAEVEEYDGDDLGGAETSVRLRQPILLDSRRGEGRKAADAEQEALEFQLAALELEILGDLRSVHAELLYLRESLTLTDDLVAFAHRSLDIAEQRFELRAAPESDVTRARVEMFDLELARRELERDRVQAEARLAALLGGLRISSDRINGALEPRLDDVSTATLAAWIESSHPELERARSEIRAAQARHRQARAERTPDFEVFVGASYSGAADETFAEGGVGIELPILNRNQGRIAEAQAEYDRARDREDEVRLRLESEWIAAVAAWDAAADRAAYHAERVLPSAKRSFEQVEEGYRAGKLEFLDLLDAQRTLTEARLQRLRLQREIREAEARLYRLAAPAYSTSAIEYVHSKQKQGDPS